LSVEDFGACGHVGTGAINDLEELVLPPHTHRNLALTVLYVPHLLARALT